MVECAAQGRCGNGMEAMPYGTSNYLAALGAASRCTPLAGELQAGGWGHSAGSVCPANATSRSFFLGLNTQQMQMTHTKQFVAANANKPIATDVKDRAIIPAPAELPSGAAVGSGCFGSIVSGCDGSIDSGGSVGLGVGRAECFPISSASGHHDGHTFGFTGTYAPRTGWLSQHTSKQPHGRSRVVEVEVVVRVSVAVVTVAVIVDDSVDVVPVTVTETVVVVAVIVDDNVDVVSVAVTETVVVVCVRDVLLVVRVVVVATRTSILEGISAPPCSSPVQASLVILMLS